MADNLQTRFKAAMKSMDNLDKEEDWLAMDISELQHRTIKFGKSKYGQEYHEVSKDTGYCAWFIGSYLTSHKPEHREFIHYLRLHTEMIEAAIGTPRGQGQHTTESNMSIAATRPRSKGYPKTKAKAKAMSSKESGPQFQMDSEEDYPDMEDWAQVLTEPNDQVAELQDRMTSMETAMNQIMYQLTQIQIGLSSPVTPNA